MKREPTYAPPRPARLRLRCRIARTAICAAAIAASALLAACAPRYRAVVVLDEAFAAARPHLCELLAAGVGASRYSVLALNASPAKALEDALAEASRSRAPVALSASPLIAKALVLGGSWEGEPPLLVPEWRGRPAPGLYAAATDPVPAYRAAGWAAGILIAELSKAGGLPSCGLLFSESPSRPRAALAAFASAYAESSEGGRLNVREILEGGNAAPEQGKTPPGPAGSEAEAAVSELLGSDIRMLFVALGPSTEAAIKAAARPGLAIGADFPYPDPPKELVFAIIPDDVALAKALNAELRTLRGAARSGGATSVNALLMPMHQASSMRVGKLDLGHILGEAALRAKGRR